MFFYESFVGRPCGSGQQNRQVHCWRRFLHAKAVSIIVWQAFQWQDSGNLLHFPSIPMENGYYVLSANGWSYHLLCCRTTLRWSTCQASHGLRLRLPRSWTQLPKSCDFHALFEWPTSCCLCLIFVCLNEESEYAFLYLLSKFWKKRIHHVWDPNVCTNGAWDISIRLV
jgi:hypothetical protein